MSLSDIALLAPFGTVAVFAWGVYQFNRSSELSFRKPYWENQLGHCILATSAAATLATAIEEDDGTR